MDIEKVWFIAAYFEWGATNTTYIDCVCTHILCSSVRSFSLSGICFGFAMAVCNETQLIKATYTSLCIWCAACTILESAGANYVVYRLNTVVP